MRIQYLFRSKELHSFSVERVFSSIIPIVSKTNIVDKRYMPEYRISLSNIVKNLIYVIKSRNNKNDIYHITGDITYTALALPRNKTVLTILDTVCLENSKGIKRWLLKTFWFYLPLRKSKYVTVISEKTKLELCKYFPFSKKKIVVVPCPVDNEFSVSNRTFNEDCPIILQVGTKDNKNLTRVIKALQGIKCELSIIGKLKNEDIELLNRYRISYKNYFNLSNADVVKKYNECDILIFVSTYEGFGMPIIEGQASGKPIITSNIEPMLSVAGKGACFVDPYDIDSIRSGVLKIINNRQYREEILKAGNKNKLLYLPESISEQYSRIYKRIILRK